MRKRQARLGARSEARTCEVKLAKEAGPGKDATNAKDVVQEREELSWIRYLTQIELNM